MKRITAIIIFFFIISTSYSQSSIDVLHYKFELKLNDKNDTIYGTAEITLKFLQPASSFIIQLVAQNDKGQGMIIDGIASAAGVQVKSFQRTNDNINITLERLVTTHDTCLFVIFYHGIPRDGLIISKNIHGDRTFFADNWPDRAHHWIPCVDNPSDKASFEFWVTTPSGYKVISNGILSQEKILNTEKKITLWKEDIPLPTKVMVIGVARFAIKEFEDSPPGIPITAWVYPQDSAKGFRNYSSAPAIVKFYSDYIGPYPYNKLANVQSKTKFGGMENASAIFYNEESAEENSSVEDLLAHEIAHQWFGDMATEKSFPHLWLSEGFATYLTDIYLESKYGTDRMNNRLKDERRKVISFAKRSDRSVIDSLSPFKDLLNANSYEKGAWVLHMLRRQMGDSAFKIFIRRYYDCYKGKNADTDDLRKIAEEVTGKNLEQFFKQWLYSPGIPQLDIQWQYNKKTEELSVTVAQSQKEIFQFPLQLEIESVQKTKIATVQITRRTETFKFKVKKLLHFTIDPNTSLLFDGK